MIENLEDMHIYIHVAIKYANNSLLFVFILFGLD